MMMNAVNGGAGSREAYYAAMQAQQQSGQARQPIAMAGTTGGYPANPQLEDTNSAFWTPAIATTVGAGLTAGTGFGLQGYNDARTKFGEKVLEDTYETELKKHMTPITETLESNRGLVSSYKTATQQASESAIERYLNQQHSGDQGAKFTAEKIAELKGKSNAEIIKELHKANIPTGGKSFRDYLTDARKQAIQNANIQKPTLQKIVPEAILNAQDQALVDTLNSHGNTGLTVDNLKATNGTIDVAKLKEPRGKFNVAVLADETINKAGKRYGMGWNGAGNKVATVLAVGAAVGGGIGLWNASQASGRNEQKLAELRAQEQGAGGATATPTQAQYQQAADMANDGMLNGRVG
jgi:hypothetical protein